MKKAILAVAVVLTGAMTIANATPSSAPCRPGISCPCTHESCSPTMAPLSPQ